MEIHWIDCSLQVQIIYAYSELNNKGKKENSINSQTQFQMEKAKEYVIQVKMISWQWTHKQELKKNPVKSTAFFAKACML